MCASWITLIFKKKASNIGSSTCIQINTLFVDNKVLFKRRCHNYKSKLWPPNLYADKHHQQVAQCGNTKHNQHTARYTVLEKVFGFQIRLTYNILL